MNSRITRREVAKQFIIAIELLLEWIEQKEDPNKKLTGEKVEEHSLDSRLRTAPGVARILNISKGVAYRLIQLKQLPSIEINRSVKVKQEDLEEFITNNKN